MAHVAEKAPNWFMRRSRKGKVGIIALAFMLLAGIAWALIVLTAKAPVTGNLVGVEQEISVEFAAVGGVNQDACNDAGTLNDPIGSPNFLSPTRSTTDTASCTWTAPQGPLAIVDGFEGYAPAARAGIKNTGAFEVKLQDIAFIGDVPSALADTMRFLGTSCGRSVAPGATATVEFGFVIGAIPSTESGDPTPLDLEIEVTPVLPGDFLAGNCPS